MAEQAPVSNVRVVQPAQSLNVWKEIPRLCVMVMEVSWIVPWFRSLTPATQATSPAGDFGIFLLIYALAHYLTRMMAGLNLRTKIRRWLMLGYVVISVWGGIVFLLQGASTSLQAWTSQPLSKVQNVGELIPPEIIVAVFMLLLIQRGVSLVKGWAGTNSVFNSIQIGVVLFTLFGIVITASTGEIAGANVYLFITAGILAMVCSRVAALSSLRGGSQTILDMRWMGSILITAVILAGAAMLVAGFASGQLERILSLLKLGFYGIVLLVTSPILWLLRQLFPAAEALQAIIPTPTPEPQIPVWEQDTGQDPAAQLVEEMSKSSIQLIMQLRTIAIALVVLVLVILILRALRSWQIRQAAEMDEERQSLYDNKSLLRMLLDALFNRLRQAAGGGGSLGRFSRKERLRAAARIRAIYTDFMDLCSDLGSPRTDAQTPLEFLPSANSLFPALLSELGAITNGYLRVRYGEYPETLAEVDEVEQAWRQVNQRGEAIKKEARQSRESAM